MAQLHNPNTRHRTAAGQFISPIKSRLVISSALEHIDYLVEQLAEDYQQLSAVNCGELVTWKKQATDIQQRLSDCWRENRDE